MTQRERERGSAVTKHATAHVMFLELVDLLFNGLNQQPLQLLSLPLDEVVERRNVCFVLAVVDDVAAHLALPEDRTYTRQDQDATVGGRIALLDEARSSVRQRIFFQGLPACKKRHHTTRSCTKQLELFMGHTHTPAIPNQPIARPATIDDDRRTWIPIYMPGYPRNMMCPSGG